ncbi:hypothetical protein Syun_012925 [Stephania yunnanensis]|uniref:Uncharacterized protein n=1 Tax=Stephania yunnanensis TaxID=152371 RepID=A0AAP0K1D7_9MAGN
MARIGDVGCDVERSQGSLEFGASTPKKKKSKKERKMEKLEKSTTRTPSSFEMADARAKAVEEAQSAVDDACSVVYEVFVEEVLTDKVLVEKTRSVIEPVVSDSNFVEPSLSSNSIGRGRGSRRERGKGRGGTTTSTPFAPLRRSKTRFQVAAEFIDQVLDL